MAYLVLRKYLYKSKGVKPYTGFKLPEKSTGEIMGKCTWLKSAAIAFLMIVIILPMLWQGNYAKADLFAPTWLKKGAYAEYNSGTYLTFLNGSYFSPANEDTKNGVFRWECLEVNDTTAKLKVSLNVNEGAGGIHLSSEIYVDTINRNVFLSNGTLIGTTRLWFPANPSQRQEVTFWNLPPENITGTVSTGNLINPNEPNYFNTIQGVQKCFMVDANGTIGGQPYFSPSLSCDLDTGVVILDFFLFEPMLLAMDVKEIIGSVELVATNVDLGPREISFDIRAAIPYVIFVAAIVIVITTVFMRRRRKLKSKNSKIAPQTIGKSRFTQFFN